MLKKVVAYLDRTAEKNEKVKDEENSYKEKLIESLQKENQDAFNQEIIQEMSEFIQNLDMKDLKKFKKMVLKFDGNTMKAFRAYRTIFRAEIAERLLGLSLVLGLWLGWNLFTFIGMFAIPTSIFHYSLIMTKGNKIFAGILSVILGIIGIYVVSLILFYSALF